MKAPLKFEDEGLKLAKDANTKVRLNELDKVFLDFPYKVWSCDVQNEK